MKHVLVTGGNGFVGRALCERMLKDNYLVSATVREESRLRDLPAGVTGVVTGHLEKFKSWNQLIAGMDVVVHSAAHVHQMNGVLTRNAESFYRSMNVEVGASLATACAMVGKPRFIFLSSVKVLGESTRNDQVWDEISPCLPEDAYGRSKCEAEKNLISIGSRCGLDVVIIRCPLVYGPGVKANFLRLLRVVDSGLPLPFAGIENRRSLLYLGNLVDSVATCIAHPKAVGEIFLVSDGKDVSTSDLIWQIGRALGRKPRMFYMPSTILRLGAKIIGKSGEIDRLLGSARVDARKISRTLAWAPPYSLEEGLARTVEWYSKTIDTMVHV